MKRLGYKEIEEQLENCPETFLPALFIKCATLCFKKNIWMNKSAAIKVINKTYEKNKKKI